MSEPLLIETKDGVFKIETDGRVTKLPDAKPERTAEQSRRDSPYRRIYLNRKKQQRESSKD